MRLLWSSNCCLVSGNKLGLQSLNAVDSEPSHCNSFGKHNAWNVMPYYFIRIRTIANLHTTWRGSIVKEYKPGDISGPCVTVCLDMMKHTVINSKE